MKIKHRALSLLLSLMIVLTFMPAMAYAIPLIPNTEGDGWSITSEDGLFAIQGEPLTLQVTTTKDGSAGMSYQWYVGDYDDNTGMDWTAIYGETESSFVTKEGGSFACAVTWNGETLIQAFSVYVETPVSGWRITNNGTGCSFEYGKSAKLTVETNYFGSDITYQWAVLDPNSGDYRDITGATGASYETKEEGEFLCKVTADGETHEGWYYASFNTDGYEWETVYPDATATYSTGDGRDLEIDFTDEWTNCNFPEAGDTITLKSGTKSDVYTYVKGEDDGWFVSEDNEVLNLGYNFDGPDVNIAAGTLGAYAYSDSNYDHANKKVLLKYSADCIMPVKIITNIESVKFEPANITLNAEDIKWVDDNGVVHDDIYSLERRSHYKDGGGEWDDFYADGDKITVTYNDGTPTRTYTYDGNDFYFKYYDGETWRGLFYPYIEDSNLEVGVNNVKIWYRGVYCTIKVTVTGAQPQQEHEHSWDGGTVTTAPTCTTAGVKTYKCSGCGETKTESIAALGHDYQEVPDSAVAATSSKAGKAADMECSRCHDKIIGAEIPKTDPKKGESFKVSGATVKVTSSGTVAYAKAKSAKSVTVPATVSLNGKTYKVTEISANAFKGNKAKTVTIGKNVKTLKAKAFNGSKVTTLNVKSKSLTKKSVKGSLKGSKVKTVKVKVGSKSQNKKYIKKYKKIFTKANAGRKVTVK